MRVAAVQFKATHGDPARSLARVAPWVQRAAAGAELVVLPEMFASGYLFASPAAARAVAEPPRGPTFSVLSPIAKAHRAWVVAGFPEAARDRLFNSAMVIDPAGGLAGVYRKTLLFDADLPWATPGDSGYLVLDADWGRIGLGICMDLNDDLFTAWLRAEQPDVVAFPTNWVEQYQDVHGYWKERLTGVNGALVAANTYGAEGRVRFSGRSAVVAGGQVRGALYRSGDGVLRVALPGV